jgi:hypothetical protein
VENDSTSTITSTATCGPRISIPLMHHSQSACAVGDLYQSLVARAALPHTLVRPRLAQSQ